MSLLRLCLIFAGLAFGTVAAFAQDYPSRPVRIVASGAGGAGDFAARLLATGLGPLLGQQVIVDNRAAILPGEIVATAPPDGYTLLLDANSFWVGPLLQPTPYDPVRDFAPITITDRYPSVLVVSPSMAANSVKELIALAKAKPGALNYGSSSPGSSPHLNMELFKAMTGTNIVWVPYKNGPLSIVGLMGGEVQAVISVAATAVPHLKSGKLKALGVTSAEPSALFPGLPTIAASGVPGYESVTMQGVFAPAKTPAAVIARLNKDMVRVLRSSEVKEKFLNISTEAVGSTPEEFAAGIKSMVAKWSKVIKDANIRVN